MGKKRSAARRAAAATAASAATTSPAVPFDTHAALVDTPAAPVMRESPTNTQQARVDHVADTIPSRNTTSPALSSVDNSLVREPATPDACADTSVAIAIPQARADVPIESRDAPPASTILTNTSCNNPRQPHVECDVTVHPALHAPFSALSALAITAAADLATAVARIGPPDLYITTPLHDFDQLDGRHPKSETLAPRTSPATSIEEIDADLLTNIIEDAQRAIRIEARREVRAKALEEGHERGWREGFEEGKRHAKREARIEEQQRERAWKDGYEMGRWAGYQEGLDVARTEVSTSPCVDTTVQTDDALRTPSPTPDTPTSTPRIDPATPHVNVAAQTDDVTPTRTTERLTAAVQTHDATPTCTIEHTDAGVQAEDPPPPSSPDDAHSLPRCVQASVQTDTPRASAPARARTPHEIEPDLLREIIATAKAKGEGDGLMRGKHVGFQDGVEAGWKSGTREGHKEGYREGKTAGIEEGREQHQTEVRRVPRAVAAVQTDEIFSTNTNSVLQMPQSHIPAPSVDDNPVSYATPHVSSNLHAITTLPDNFPKSHNDLFPPYNDPSLSYNDTDTSFTTAHMHIPSFSWAEDASSLPVITPAPLISPPPRDFSVLRSSSARPFDSLKRRARRSQARPTRPSCPPRLSIPTPEPIITWRHPVGLRADRPSVIISSSPLVPHSVKLEAPPLDWQGDPRLQELG